MVSKAVTRLICLTVSAAITAALLAPPSFTVPLYQPSYDKLHHVAAGLVLIALLYIVTLKPITSSLAAALYLASIELIQPAVGRTADINDFCAGLIGCLIAITPIFIIHHFHRKEPYNLLGSRSVKFETE